MNSMSPSIKFTMEVYCLLNCDRPENQQCSQIIEYLDVSMWIDSHGQIQSDLNRKPNTKCKYLLQDSPHPRHCFPGIAKSLAHRVVRICSKSEDRDRRLGELRVML